MKFDKKMYGIYMTTAVILVGVVYMGVSSFYIMSDVSNGSSVDIAIDKRIDECYEREKLFDY